MFFFMFLLSQYSFWLQTKDKTLPWFPKAQRDIVKHLVFPNQKSKNRRHLDRTIMQNEKRVTVLNIWSFVFCLCFQAVSVSLPLTWRQVLFFCLQMDLVEFAAENKTKKKEKWKRGKFYWPSYLWNHPDTSFIYIMNQNHIYINIFNFQLVYMVIIWFLKNI